MSCYFKLLFSFVLAVSGHIYLGKRVSLGHPQRAIAAFLGLSGGSG